MALPTWPKRSWATSEDITREDYAPGKTVLQCTAQGLATIEEIHLIDMPFSIDLPNTLTTTSTSWVRLIRIIFDAHAGQVSKSLQACFLAWMTGGGTGEFRINTWSNEDGTTEGTAVSAGDGVTPSGPSSVQIKRTWQFLDIQGRVTSGAGTLNLSNPGHLVAWFE